MAPNSSRTLGRRQGGPFRPVLPEAIAEGLIRPGDRIDVLGTFSFPSKKAPGEMETATLTLLQDVTVLATGQQTARQRMGSIGESHSAGMGYGTITVEVTPHEAELLVFAQQARGQLFLSLRHPDDISFEADLPAVNFDHIKDKLHEYNTFRQNEIRRKSGRK